MCSLISWCLYIMGKKVAVLWKHLVLVFFFAQEQRTAHGVNSS